MKRLTALLLSATMLVCPAHGAEFDKRSEETMPENGVYRAYSSDYTEITTLSHYNNRGYDGWRDGLVAGNGENGLIESCGPATDVMIFQNMKFGYPTNAIRMTPNTSSVREETMKDILDNGGYLSASGAQAANDAMVKAAGEWTKKMGISDSWQLQYTYAFHPAHQLRLQMADAKNGEEMDYIRYTDYETGEIGTIWTDKEGKEWERKSFASREDNVNITSLKSTNGGKINLTLSIDDIARMSNEGGVDTDLSTLRYRKVVDKDHADYIGISAHYPFYKNSLFNNAGFGGITRVVIKGGSKSYVFGTTTADPYKNPVGGATDTEMNLGEDKEPKIEIKDADEVYLITKTELDTDMGTLGDFEKKSLNPEYLDKLISDTKAAWDKYESYDKALAPSAKLHSEIMDRLTYSVCVTDEDKAMRAYTNEELIEAQKKSPDRLLPAMMERLYLNGRFANVCSSGIQAPRLGGMWTGAWGCEWSGDYTTDANINLQIAGANIGSVPEETVGFMNVMLKNVTDWQLNAKQIYGIDDALLAPSRTDGHSATLIHWGSWPGQMWISGAAWLIFPMYEYYQCFGNMQVPLTPDIRKELEFTGNLYEGYTEIKDKYGNTGEYHDYEIYDGKTGERVVYNLRNTLMLTDERAAEILKEGYFDLERDILYPLVTKTANFYMGFVDERFYVKDGKAYFDENHTTMAKDESWYIAPSYSPENAPSNTGKSYTANATMDSAASRSIMDMATELEGKLNYAGRDERIENYKYYSEHIPPYLYENGGELKEWTLYGYNESYGHRHGSQLYGLWPLYEAETDKELFDGAKKLIETKNSVPTGDGRSGHGWLHRALASARIKDADGVRNTLLPLVSKSMIYNSMMMSHNNDRTAAYCTDPVITIPAVQLESLVYTDTGTLELLPAVPDELRLGGSLEGSMGMSLRCGGKLKSLSWDGKNVTAVIKGCEDVNLKLTQSFENLMINGKDVTKEIQTDDTGDRYYEIKTNDEITAEFSLTLIEKITVSSDKTHAHSGDTMKITAKCEPEGISGILWEVQNVTGSAEIDRAGTLTAKAKGDVKVRAKAIGGDTVSEWMNVEILGGKDELTALSSSDYTVFGRTEGQWETSSPPSYAFDGKAETAYDGQNGGYCGIALKSPAKISAFGFMPRRENEYRMVNTFFQVSKDGKDYTTIYTVPEAGNYGTYYYIYVDDLSSEAQALLQSGEVTHFRFYSGGSQFSNIAEIEVYTGVFGLPTDARVTNLAKFGQDVFWSLSAQKDGEYDVYCAVLSPGGVKSVTKESAMLGSGEETLMTKSVPEDSEITEIYVWRGGTMVPASVKSAAEDFSRLTLTSSGQNASAFHPLPEKRGKVSYSFELTDNASRDSGILFGNSENLNASSQNYFASGSIDILFANGSIYTRDPSEKTKVASYDEKKRVSFTIDAYIDENTYDLYVNGTLAAENVKFRTSAAAIDTLALVENGGGAMFNIDNLKISRPYEALVSTKTEVVQ